MKKCIANCTQLHKYAIGSMDEVENKLSVISAF